MFVEGNLGLPRSRVRTAPRPCRSKRPGWCRQGSRHSPVRRESARRGKRAESRPVTEPFPSAATGFGGPGRTASRHGDWGLSACRRRLGTVWRTARAPDQVQWTSMKPVMLLRRAMLSTGHESPSPQSGRTPVREGLTGDAARAFSPGSVAVRLAGSSKSGHASTQVEPRAKPRGEPPSRKIRSGSGGVIQAPQRRASLSG